MSDHITYSPILANLSKVLVVAVVIGTIAIAIYLRRRYITRDERNFNNRDSKKRL